MFKPPPLTPETITILPLAIAFDLAAVVLLLFGMDDWGIIDVLGTIFIGTWLFFRKGKPIKNKKDKIRQLFTSKQGRFLTPILGEFIPYLGVLPFWTLSVYFNLTDE